MTRPCACTDICVAPGSCAQYGPGYLEAALRQVSKRGPRPTMAPAEVAAWEREQQKQRTQRPSAA